MKNSFPKLFIEISEPNITFCVGEDKDENNFKINYKITVASSGIDNNSISNFENLFNIIKQNIYIIEEKFNYTFTEVVLVLENFNHHFINLSGFKKLNGSQVLKENITYILNKLKSYINRIYQKQTVIHIFNSKFNLDNKKIENLPIGLFGDFYSHELSFVLLQTNEYKNFKTIFDKCNLKIKRIFIKSFIEGANTSNKFINMDTFFQIKIDNNKSKIFFFENNALKSEQNFNFGSEIILRDISKITSLKIDVIKKIMNEVDFKEIAESDLLEEKYFKDNNYRKIKKKLIYDIAMARVKEIFELIIFNNINFQYYFSRCKVIFLVFDEINDIKGLKEFYKLIFLSEDRLDARLIEHSSSESINGTINKLVHFGWNKEAIPITMSKKSLIATFFDKIFS